jgi:cytochrome c-type biogenesis protein
MAGFDVSYLAALVAGLLSFLSPCVLPLVPPYLCFLGGISARQLSGVEALDRADARRVVLAAAMFVLGFATVFIAFGATATTFGRLVVQHLQWLGYVAGVIIILLGLHFLGVLRLGLLYRDARVHINRRPAGLLGAYVVGLAFAFGWTPCVGPVLASILFVAAAEETAWRGATLLAAYAAGIGMPFLLAAFAARPFMAFMHRFRAHIHRIEQVTGGLLVLTGILFLTGSMNVLAYWLLETFPALGRLG